MSKGDELQRIELDLESLVGKLPLVESVTDIVMGEGSAVAEVVFIGEAPGYYEWVEKRPFVGRSGQLLRSTLVEIGLSPEKVYITNIVKARPPENRDPTPEEIFAFKPFLDQEILTISPKLICTLGRFSMAKFLPDVFISHVHGRLHRVIWQERLRYVLPLYHPAAALRSTKLKKSFVSDLKKIPQVLTWIENQTTTQHHPQSILQALV